MGGREGASSRRRASSIRRTRGSEYILEVKDGRKAAFFGSILASKHSRDSMRRSPSPPKASKTSHRRRIFCRRSATRRFFNQTNFDVAPYCFCILPQRLDGRRMLSPRFQAGNCAFTCSHGLRNLFLCETCAYPGRQKFADKSVFILQRGIRGGKTFSFRHRGQKLIVIMRNRFIFTSSHDAPPSIFRGLYSNPSAEWSPFSLQRRGV